MPKTKLDSSSISKLEDVPRVTKLDKKQLNLDVHNELKVSNAEIFGSRRRHGRTK
jgi:hypothetical protein